MVYTTELSDTNIWRPAKDPGQPRGLDAIVLGYGKAEGDFGPFATCLMREVSSKHLWSLGITGEVLLNAFDRERPLPDERIRVRYKGMTTSQRTGRDYVDWSLEVQRAPRVPDWDKLRDGVVELVPADAAPALPAPEPVDATPVDVEIDDRELPAPPPDPREQSIEDAKQFGDAVPWDDEAA